MSAKSSNLSSFELLHRENLFIRLKNYGQNLDEIAMLLDVEKELVEKWDEEFEKEKSNLSQTSPNFVKSNVIKRKSSKEYLIEQIVSFEMNLLERVIFDLQRLLFATSDSLVNGNSSFDNIEMIAKKAIIDLQTHLNFIDTISVDKVTKQITAQFRGKEENLSKEKELAIKNAIGLWCRFFYKFKEDILITETKTEIYFNYFKTLPCAIKQLKIQNYHSIANIHLENLNIDAQWIFLFGENGFGKTSILQAIALSLLANSKEIENINIEKTTKIAVEFINDYINQINNFGENSQLATENLVCYGSSRLNMGGENTNEDESKKSGLIYSLFHTDGMLLNIEKYLILWFLAEEDKEKFAKVVEAFKIIIPYLQDIQVVKNEQREFEVHYFEKIIDETGEPTGSTQKVSFNHLAAGLKSVLAMVGDMFIRLYRTQPLVINPRELVGIAIIDELELHLHPKWQIKLPQLLSSVFPKVQFIASTHSAIPLLGATPNAVFIKVTRDKEKGIQAQKMDIDLKNLTPNQLFYFLFDMESITSVNNTNLAEVRTEDTKAEFLKNDEVKARLKAFEAKKAAIDFPDDLFEPENSVVK